MTKQERLKQVIHEAISPYLIRGILGGFETAILRRLSEEGVVIRVDRELPKYYCGYVDYEKDADGEFDISKPPIFHDLYNRFNENQEKALREAGYVAVEELLEASVTTTSDKDE